MFCVCTLLQVNCIKQPLVLAVFTQKLWTLVFVSRVWKHRESRATVHVMPKFPWGQSAKNTSNAQWGEQQQKCRVCVRVCVCGGEPLSLMYGCYQLFNQTLSATVEQTQTNTYYYQRCVFQCPANITWLLSTSVSGKTHTHCRWEDR